MVPAIVSYTSEIPLDPLDDKHMTVAQVSFYPCLLDFTTKRAMIHAQCDRVRLTQAPGRTRAWRTFSSTTLIGAGDHTNLTILHAGCKAQDKQNSRKRGLQDPCVYVVFGFEPLF